MQMSCSACSGYGYRMGARVAVTWLRWPGEADRMMQPGPLGGMSMQPLVL